MTRQAQVSGPPSSGRGGDPCPGVRTAGPVPPPCVLSPSAQGRELTDRAGVPWGVGGRQYRGASCLRAVALCPCLIGVCPWPRPPSSSGRNSPHPSWPCSGQAVVCTAGPRVGPAPAPEWGLQGPRQTPSCPQAAEAARGLTVPDPLGTLALQRPLFPGPGGRESEPPPCCLAALRYPPFHRKD